MPIEKQAASRNGKTRDISTRGVYFILENDLNAGSELDLTMTLPAEITGGTEVFIRAIGKVVRVEKRPENGHQHVGVAAVIERYEIIRNEAMRASRGFLNPSPSNCLRILPGIRQKAGRRAFPIDGKVPEPPRPPKLFAYGEYVDDTRSGYNLLSKA